MRLIKNTSFSLLVLLCMISQNSAFELNGSKWPTGEAEFYVEIAGTAASGITWNTAFIEAMNDWNNETSFNFILREEYKDPCANDGLSSVDFREDFCGSAFGENTLGVTVRRFASSVLGAPALVESNIIIDQNKELNVFDGNLVQFGIQGIDFRRIALHELGHALGLDHEDNNAAIMAPNIGNLDRLQPDDIAGAEKLYDGVINCAVSELAFGAINNALDANDCTVSELLPGSDDSSAIDLYRFSLTNPATLSLTMTSQTLDSVLLIADENFQVIGFDDSANEQCDSSLTQFLSAGNYFLLANTFDSPVKSECGTTGNYEIDAVLTSTGLNPLGSSASLSGASANATFIGGITSNNGALFKNRFSPSESLDITARITVDPKHAGQAGFLVIAAVVDDQILFVNEQGQAVDSAANPGVITRASSKTLAAIENITVVDDFVPSSLGISDTVVGFYFGYGLDSKPDELYYHQAPLNLILDP